MNELVRFLIARIDDDEAELKKRARVLARKDGKNSSGENGSAHTTVVLAGPTSLDRMRAECLSKRQLLGEIQQLLVLRDQPQEKPVRDVAGQMLHSMALPYAGHPAFPRL